MEQTIKRSSPKSKLRWLYACYYAFNKQQEYYARMQNEVQTSVPPVCVKCILCNTKLRSTTTVVVKICLLATQDLPKATSTTARFVQWVCCQSSFKINSCVDRVCISIPNYDVRTMRLLIRVYIIYKYNRTGFLPKNLTVHDKYEYYERTVL